MVTLLIRRGIALCLAEVLSARARYRSLPSTKCSSTALDDLAMSQILFRFKT